LEETGKCPSAVRIGGKLEAFARKMQRAWSKIVEKGGFPPGQTDKSRVSEGRRVVGGEL
jgi:hypothetical protein